MQELSVIMEKKNKPPKIIKANIFHSMLFKTLPFARALRYSLSLFISGMFFFVVSFDINSESITEILQILSCTSIILSIYLLPFFDVDKIEKFLSKFIIYMFVSIFFVIYTLVWLAFCKIDITNRKFIVFIILLMSILELAFMVIAANNILKPIMYIISQISIVLKKHAEENNERTFITYLKTLCADLSVIVSFILTVTTFIITIYNHINPLEWADKIIT